MSGFLTPYGKGLIGKQVDFVTPNTSLSIPIEEGVFSFSPKLEVFLREEAMRGGPHGFKPLLGGFYGSTLTIRKPLFAPSDTVLAANPTERADSLILEQAFGAMVTSGYQLAATQAADCDTATLAIIEAKDDTLYKAGGGVVVFDGAQYGLAPIKSITPQIGDFSVVALGVPLAFDPSGGLDAQNTYGARCAYLTKAARAAHTIHFQGEGADFAVYFAGCMQESLKGTLDPMGILWLEATYRVADVMLDEAGADITPYEYSSSPLPVLLGSNGARLIRGGATPNVATDLDVNNLSFEIALSHSAFRGHGPTSGVRDVRVDPKFKLMFTQVMTGAPDLGLAGNATQYPLFFTVGTQPGAMFGLYIPKPIIAALPGWTAVEQLHAQSYEVIPGLVTGDDPTTDAPANSFARALLA